MRFRDGFHKIMNEIVIISKREAVQNVHILSYEPVAKRNKRYQYNTKFYLELCLPAPIQQVPCKRVNLFSRDFVWCIPGLL